IADEPTTALDVTIQAEIVELLKRINKERGTAILFISHDLSLVNTLCENVLVMQNGLVVESGKCDSIFNNPKEDYTKKLISAIPKNPFYKG
ncbi:MAG: ABC transporter ATP-binding protein, partial [Lachnospiraceae bacterium]|nr:ABC transporter ATP-binding protein [Lachnospiraceae bacterium]